MNGWKAALAATLLVGGCVGLAFFSLRPRAVEKPKPVPEVKAVAPKTATEQTFPCRIAAQQTIWAGTPVTGPIEAVYVDVGQNVTDGQVLARVKSGPVTQAVAGMEQDASREHAKQITARLASAQQEAKLGQTEVLRARSALARIEPVFRKQELLHEAGATPRLVYEKAREEYQLAQKTLAAAEETSRQSDNTASRLADEQHQAEELAQVKARAVVAVVSEVATAEIHAPAAGLLLERRITAEGSVTEANRTELFRIAVHPELLRAEFGPEFRLQAGQSISLRVGSVLISAVMNTGESADFESHLSSVTIGTPCQASLRIK